MTLLGPESPMMQISAACLRYLIADCGKLAAILHSSMLQREVDRHLGTLHLSMGSLSSTTPTPA
jgi:hypothetical protein